MKHWIALFALLSSVPSPAEPEVRVAGLQVVWEDDREAFDGFSLFNGQQALVLGLLVDGGGAGLIEFDDENSRLTALRDDFGTKLDGKIGSFPKISEDGKLLRLVIESEKLPKPGASQLQAKGELAVLSASETETLKCGPVKLEEDAKLDFGDQLDFRVVKVGKPDWGDAAWQVELEIKRDIAEMAVLRFYDGDGKEIESDRVSTGRMGFMGQVSVTLGYTLAREVAEVRVELDRWTDLEKLSVPFEVSVGIGGPVGD